MNNNENDVSRVQVLLAAPFFLIPVKLLPLLVLVAALASSGCARHYVITTNNGSQITTNSRPKKKDGYYFYKDLQGNKTSIFAGRVAEIAPATSEKKKKTSTFEFIPAGQ